MEEHGIVVSITGWHHVVGPNSKRIGTVTRAPNAKNQWCEVKSVEGKAVMGDDLFPTREIAIKALFGVGVQREQEEEKTADANIGIRQPTEDVETLLGEETMSAAAAKQSKPVMVRGSNPGIIATIELTLRRAGRKGTSVSKGDILKTLTKAFPDRKETAMENTIRMAPGHFIKNGIKVKKVKGPPMTYFIVPTKEESRQKA